MRNHNFKLLERLFGFENFSIDKFDKDFNNFCNKSFFLNYELSKTIIKREQQNNEKLQKIIENKNEELNKMKEQISNLEKVNTYFLNILLELVSYNRAS